MGRSETLENIKMNLRASLKMLATMSEPTKSMMVAQLQRQAENVGLDWDEVTQGIDIG